MQFVLIFPVILICLGLLLRIVKVGNAKICHLRINYVLTVVVSSDEFWGELVIGRKENDSVLRK